MRIVLVLEYDGSHYCGWQSQPEGCSIQDALEAALSRIAQEKIRVVTAGRTDTGVHALFQVVHFDTQVQRPVSAWVRGVNALLPADIAQVNLFNLMGEKLKVNRFEAKKLYEDL